MNPNTYTVKYRRKREGKTEYRARRNLLSSRKHRVVIRKSLQYITIQVIEYVPGGDRIVLAVSSKKLRDFGWKFGLKNTSAAYLTGLLAGVKAKELKVKSAVVDLGRQTTSKGNKLFAAIKGLMDAGLDVKASAKIAPSNERIEGAHIAGLKDQLSKEQFKNQCSSVKDSLQTITTVFRDVKKKIAP